MNSRWRATTRDSNLDQVGAGPARAAPALEPPPTHYRAIWISDLHLGTQGCQAGLLLDFLRRTESDYLYLVGDIVDAWQLRRRWYWPQAHNDVLQKLIRKARKGTRVVFIPGNHDEIARQFGALAFGGIRIENETIHVTANGKRLLVIHGDLFDGVVQHAKWLAVLGDHAYTTALKLNQWLNSLRARCKLPYWSLAAFLKLRVKNAVLYISRFEEALAAEARRMCVDGVVCGHIHKAEIRMIDGILYCNDGDWVDSLTALVESEEGELSLVNWRGAVVQTGARSRYAATSRPATARAPDLVPDYAPAPGD
ncbi:MAG: UDP-2,3-diacylglucosamine diphosphatase [Betaproteobacteria bacterium]|nr:UDP-2,3-diacylglucosamine diphosphatase [Betaproteobacteria bacterium]